MSLVAIGLNHHTAPVEVRERITFAPERVSDALIQLQNQLAVPEAAIVSTCNRTEIYCGMDTRQTGHVVNWLHDFHQAPSNTFSPYLFMRTDQAVVQHLMRVCSGLDSLILGEPQILGQIKEAYREAGEHGSVGKNLSMLFQSAFNVAKQVRTDTAVGASPVSVAFAAVSLAKQIFGELDEHTALLIGAGETVELALQHLKSSSIGNVIIANRTLEKAQVLAEQCNGEAATLAAIPELLHRADITIASTASQLPILGKGAVEQALKARKHRPMAMIDIAVPRDIEPQVSDLSDVFLYTVDDLSEIIDRGMQARRQAAEKAEHIIEHQATDFMRKLRGVDAGATISAIRTQVGELQQETLDRALAMIAKGDAPEKVLKYYAHTFSNKLLHTPSTQLRAASETGDEKLLACARQLFDIDAAADHERAEAQLPDQSKKSD